MSKANETNVRVIESATENDVRSRDHVIWEWAGVVNGVALTERRESIAHHRNKDGDWCDKNGRKIIWGEGAGITITIRRPITKEG